MMMRSRWARVLLVVVIAVFLLAGVVAFVMFGPPRVAERFAEPEFCASCHVMEPQFAAYQAGSHDHVDSCNDCHLPNDGFVRHYFWEGIVGVRDLVEFNLNMIPEHIRVRERSRDWIEENCLRCHREAVSTAMMSEGRRCWQCHQELYHDSVLQAEGRRRPIWHERTE